MAIAHWRILLRHAASAAVIVTLAALGALAEDPARQASTDQRAEQKPDTPAGAEPAPPGETQGEETDEQRTSLNLLGQTDTSSGESRRNENVQFNLIDNNALKELNVRLGTTATIVERFEPDWRYFGTEFGAPPERPLHVTAPGTSGVHGTLFESHNNSIFSARSFFQAGDVKPARENHYGLTFTAPLWTGANLSLDASQQKIRGSVNGNVLVPRADERTPLTGDPELRPIVERYLAAYPDQLPNRTDIDERMLNTNSPQLIDTNRAGAWGEQAVNDKDRLTARYLFTSQSVNAFQFVAGQNPDTEIKSHSARLNWNRAWNPGTVSELTFGFDRLGSLLVPEEDAVGPSVFIYSIERLGPMPTIPINRAINRFRYAGRLRHSRGAHLVTTGFEVVRRQYNGSEVDGHRGIVRFSRSAKYDDITNLRWGIPSQYTAVTGDVHRGYRNLDLAFYIGDKWQARSNLTFDIGLRFEVVTRPDDVNGLSDLPFGCDCNNVAPRFGFAYRMKGRWGVVRGAYGLLYGQIFPVTYGLDRLNPPHSYRIVIDKDPNLADPTAGVDMDNLGPDTVSGIYRLSADLATPYSHQYNFSWQPELSRHVSLQLGYAGSRSHKLFTMWFNNRGHPVDGIAQTSATINQRQADPRYLEILDIVNGSRGYYDAARVSAVLRRWKGLSLDASYWFSKAIDLGGDYTTTLAGIDARTNRSQSEFDVHADIKAVSNFDQPHAFLFRTSYGTSGLAARGGWWRKLFGSWNVSAVLLLKSGTPFTVQSGSDRPGFGNVDGQGSDRVNLLDVSVLGRTIGDPDTSTLRLPATAFQFIEPADPRGNLGRNTFRKGSIANLNVSLSRTWKIRSEKSLTLRAESINFLNTAQFAEPTKTLTSSSFGQITNTLNDGRAFRFLLRFAF